MSPISHLPSAFSATLRIPSPSLRRAAPAFTLLEVVLALAVSMLIIGIAILSIGSLGKERTLRAHAGVLEATARGALQESIRTGNVIPLTFTPNAFALGTKSHPLDSARLEIQRPGEKRFRSPEPNEPWTFHPSGLCEPIAVRITSDLGKIELHFDPLTASADPTSVEIF